MVTALVLNSSVNGSASISRQLVGAAIENLKQASPAAEIVFRDLDAAPIPHLNGETTPVIIKGAAPANDVQAEALALSNQLVDELKAADIVVIGAPMYNFGIPSTLKTWFDYVLRAGVTFRYTEQGPIGLVTRKKVIVVEARAGLYSEGDAVAMDSQEPHLRTMLGLMGMTDVTFVRVEKLAFGPEAAEASLASARGHLDRITGADALAA